MQSIEFEALNTPWSVLVETDHDIEKLTEKIKALAANFEEKYSRFESSSLVVDLNDIGRLIDPPEELVAMLEYSLELYEVSNGAFDISVCGELEKAGLGLPGGADRSQNLVDDLKINRGEVTVANGIHVGFDGFIKGWLVAKIQQALVSVGIKEFVIDAAGDMQVGVNRESLAIEDPIKSGLTLGKVNLVNAALSTTTNLGSEWKYKGKDHSHIPDKHDDDVLVIYVLAGSAVLADAMATTLFLVSHKERIRIAEHYGVEFMEVKEGQQIFRTAGFTLSDEYVARTDSK